jgi:hypothetical protein
MLTGALSEAEDWYHLGMMLVEMHGNRLDTLNVF